MYSNLVRQLFFLATVVGLTTGFIPGSKSVVEIRNNIHQTTTTQLAFGIPKFLQPKSDDDDTATTKKVNGKNGEPVVEDDKNKIGIKALLQLVAAGAGAPFLGDFEGVDKETGKFMFSLEANNLVDENGQSKQTQMPYFENGWVDENDQGFQWPWEKKK